MVTQSSDVSKYTCFCQLDMAVMIHFTNKLTHLVAVSLSSQTMLIAPTRSLYKPRFLEYDWQTMISSPCSAKKRGAQASSSRLPVANPWYATSKKGMWLLALQSSAISAHCSFVGSTPVGL